MPKNLYQKLILHKKKLLFFGLAILILDFYMWFGVITAENENLYFHFLPVGQGDSELLVLPGRIKILIDGGPANGRALEEIGKLLGPTDRRIDLVLLSHPQTDHFGGLFDIVEHYEVGMFLWSGEMGESEGFRELLNLLSEKKIPKMALVRGDTFCYEKSCGKILWPEANYRSEGENDKSLVVAFEGLGLRVLFTGDLGASAEKDFLKTYTNSVDVLKVAHHGSRFATSFDFLSTLHPKVAIIEVGENKYGHPTEETIRRILDIGAQLFRVDRDGLVTLETNGEKLRVFSGVH